MGSGWRDVLIFGLSILGVVSLFSSQFFPKIVTFLAIAGGILILSAFVISFSKILR